LVRGRTRKGRLSESKGETGTRIIARAAHGTVLPIYKTEKITDIANHVLGAGGWAYNMKVT